MNLLLIYVGSEDTVKSMISKIINKHVTRIDLYLLPEC